MVLAVHGMRGSINLFSVKSGTIGAASNSCHYFTLQTLHCSIVQRYTDVQCSTWYQSAVQCCTVQYIVVLCSKVQYSAVQCNRVSLQCRTVQYSAVECSTVQYSVITVPQGGIWNNPSVVIDIFVLEQYKGSGLRCSAVLHYTALN